MQREDGGWNEKGGEHEHDAHERDGWVRILALWGLIGGVSWSGSELFHTALLSVLPPLVICAMLGQCCARSGKAAMGLLALFSDHEGDDSEGEEDAFGQGHLAEDPLADPMEWIQHAFDRCYHCSDAQWPVLREELTRGFHRIRRWVRRDWSTDFVVDIQGWCVSCVPMEAPETTYGWVQAMIIPPSNPYAELWAHMKHFRFDDQTIVRANVLLEAIYMIELQLNHKGMQGPTWFRRVAELILYSGVDDDTRLERFVGKPLSSIQKEERYPGRCLRTLLDSDAREAHGPSWEWLSQLPDWDPAFIGHALATGCSMDNCKTGNCSTQYVLCLRSMAPLKRMFEKTQKIVRAAVGNLAGLRGTNEPSLLDEFIEKHGLSIHEKEWVLQYSRLFPSKVCHQVQAKP